jgi:hypothetical protein
MSDWPPRFTLTAEGAVRLIVLNFTQERDEEKTVLAITRLVNEAYEQGIKAGSSTQETLEIPDFLRNEDNLRAERAAQETRPAHTAAHDCACADCVKAETPAAPTEHAVYGGRIMTLRECMEAEETPPARRQPDYSKGPITHDCTGADCTDESHSLNRGESL